MVGRDLATMRRIATCAQSIQTPYERRLANRVVREGWAELVRTPVGLACKITLAGTEALAAAG